MSSRRRHHEDLEEDLVGSWTTTPSPAAAAAAAAAEGLAGGKNKEGQQQSDGRENRNQPKTFRQQRAASAAAARPSLPIDGSEEEEESEDDESTRPGAINVDGRLPPSDGTVVYSMADGNDGINDNTAAGNNNIGREEEDNNLVVAELAPTTVEGIAIPMPTSQQQQPSEVDNAEVLVPTSSSPPAVDAATSSCWSWKKAMVVLILVLVAIFIGIVVLIVVVLQGKNNNNNNDMLTATTTTATEFPSTNSPSIMADETSSDIPTTANAPVITSPPPPTMASPTDSPNNNDGPTTAAPTSNPTTSPTPRLTPPPPPTPNPTPLPTTAPRPTLSPTFQPTRRPTNFDGIFDNEDTLEDCLDCIEDIEDARDCLRDCADESVGFNSLLELCLDETREGFGSEVNSLLDLVDCCNFDSDCEKDLEDAEDCLAFCLDSCVFDEAEQYLDCIHDEVLMGGGCDLDDCIDNHYGIFVGIRQIRSTFQLGPHLFWDFVESVCDITTDCCPPCTERMGEFVDCLVNDVAIPFLGIEWNRTAPTIPIDTQSCELEWSGGRNNRVGGGSMRRRVEGSIVEEEKIENRVDSWAVALLKKMNHGNHPVADFYKTVVSGGRRLDEEEGFDRQEAFQACEELMYLNAVSHNVTHAINRYTECIIAAAVEVTLAV